MRCPFDAGMPGDRRVRLPQLGDPDETVVARKLTARKGCKARQPASCDRLSFSTNWQDNLTQSGINNIIQSVIHKPSGYNSISPYFVVNGAQKMIDLLKKLFNANELRRYDAADGTIMHVEVQIDDSVIRIGDSSEEFPTNSLLTHVYVSNVDEVFNKAIEFGCIALEAPREREGDPDRRGIFKDFAGNVWSIAAQL